MGVLSLDSYVVAKQLLASNNLIKMASSKDNNDLSELLADALKDFEIADKKDDVVNETKPMQESMEDVLKMLNSESKNNVLPSNDEELEKMFHEFAKNLGSDNAGAASA